MKALYEWIKRHGPEEIWLFFQISDCFATPEGVKAFVKVYERVQKTIPERGPCVMVNVEFEKDESCRDKFVVIENDGSMGVRIPIIRKNLSKILGIFIPGDLENVYITMIMNVLFRNLVKEELEKPKYESMKLRRKLTAELSDSIWKKVYRVNSDMFQTAKKEYFSNVLKDQVRKEALRSFPEMGRPLYWNHLILSADYSEEFCRSLYPENPPSHLRFREVKAMITKELVMMGLDLHLGSHLRRRSDLTDKLEKDIEEFNLRSQVKKRIVVEKNHIPGVGIPIIYIVDEEGERKEVQPDTLEHAAEYAVVVRDNRWRGDYKTLIGYIFLYLAYPLRMHREMKTLQVQEIAHRLKLFAEADLP